MSLRQVKTVFFLPHLANEEYIPQVLISKHLIFNKKSPFEGIFFMSS